MSGSFFVEYLDKEREIMSILTNYVPKVEDEIYIKTKRMKKYRHYTVSYISHLVSNDGEFDCERFRVLLK